MKRRPSALAVRALNQYRRRDVIAYLGLRYYLHSSSAQSEQWARNLTPKLVLTRNSRPYFQAHHFKEIGQNARINHRPIFLPGPNEALAEVALLDECSKRPQAFANPNCVFSYHLAPDADLSGAFQNYFYGLRARHDGIAKACDSFPGSIVRCLDIKRFYPSIPAELAQNEWRRQAEAAQLPESFKVLGERLIADYKATARADERGILTGPMFSHLLANLVLRDFDNALIVKYPGRYFRYVDDITIVGDAHMVQEAESEISNRLEDLGFSLHGDESDKSLRVPAANWLVGRNDYRDDQQEISWKTLIGNLKNHLLANPSSRAGIQNAFASHGLRIPIHDYSAATHERGNLEKIMALANFSWFRRKSQSITLNSLVSDALTVRARYENELGDLLTPAPPVGYKKKRLIPKLRFLAGRLAYLSEPETLKKFAISMSRYSELQFHTGVLKAIATREIDDLLAMGTNVAQAAAQPLRAANARCKMARPASDDATRQSLAVFTLNGVTVDRPASGSNDDTLLRFAMAGPDLAMMRSGDSFLRELACLHGLSEPRHSGTLESAFDEDEHLAIDAVEQLQESASL